jgi:hypothetical protein
MIVETLVQLGYIKQHMDLRKTVHPEMTGNPIALVQTSQLRIHA